MMREEEEKRVWCPGERKRGIYIRIPAIHKQVMVMTKGWADHQRMGFSSSLGGWWCWQPSRCRLETNPNETNQFTSKRRHSHCHQSTPPRNTDVFLITSGELDAKEASEPEFTHSGNLGSSSAPEVTVGSEGHSSSSFGRADFRRKLNFWSSVEEQPSPRLFFTNTERFCRSLDSSTPAGLTGLLKFKC